MEAETGRNLQIDPADLEVLKNHRRQVRPDDTPEVVAAMARHLRQEETRNYQEDLETWTKKRN